MAAFAERFVRVLDALTADPSMAVGDADIFTEADRAMLAQVPAPVTSTRAHRLVVGRSFHGILLRRTPIHWQSRRVRCR